MQIDIEILDIIEQIARIIDLNVEEYAWSPR